MADELDRLRTGPPGAPQRSAPLTLTELSHHRAAWADLTTSNQIIPTPRPANSERGAPLCRAQRVRCHPMGLFLAVSAFQTEQAGQVLTAVEGFFDLHGLPAQRVEVDQADADDQGRNEVLIYAATNGWTVALWPSFFFDLPAAEFISRSLGTLASTVHIYDGDYWAHALVDDGRVVDRCAQVPGYFVEDRAELAKLSRKWRGDPTIVAELTRTQVADILPYLVSLTFTDDGLFLLDGHEPGKAFPDDEFERDDPWVFVDFWRRLGITYPSEHNSVHARIRLAPDWSKVLPSGDRDL